MMNLGAPGNAGKEQGCFLLENCWGSRALHLPAASNTALRIGSTRGPGGFLGEQSSGTNPVLSDLSPGSRDSFPEFSNNPLFTSWLIFGVSQLLWALAAVVSSTALLQPLHFGRGSIQGTKLWQERGGCAVPQAEPSATLPCPSPKSAKTSREM